jgi:hypothetical protein
MPLYRTEPPANSLAHWPVKTDDVERTRGVLYDVERHIMRERLLAAVQRELARRKRRERRLTKPN